MKFRVERDALADAVAWVARSLPSRPAVPVLAGILLQVDGDRLTASGYDYEVSTEVRVDAADVVPGRVLVSGRLLADITKALPAKPVQFAMEGARLTLVCGSAEFALPTMPAEDYPALPALPDATGTLPGSVLAAAVAQVAVAAGRDDTLPMLTGVQLEINDDRLTLVATDRYRIAIRELTWIPHRPVSTTVLVPARTLADTARTLAGDPEVVVALNRGDEPKIGFAGPGRHLTARLLDAQFPPNYRAQIPASYPTTAQLPVAGFVEAVKRVALVAGRRTPLRLDFVRSTLTLTVASDEEGRAREQLDVGFAGQPFSVGVNPGYLLDGLGAVQSAAVRLSFTTATKPIVLSPVRDGAAGGPPPAPEYLHLIGPMRLPQ